MENAVEALKMAFAVMVFVIALSVSMIAFNQAKSTSDILLYKQDEASYYDYTEETGKAAENRIVGIETIIPTLYKYYKENYTVVFREADYNISSGEFSNIKPLELYQTPSNSEIWGNTSNGKSNYESKMNTKYKSIFEFESSYDFKNIFSFDLEEETLRHEPWTGSYAKVKENLDCFIEGKEYKNPNNNIKYIEYTEGFISKCVEKKYKFVETVAEYDKETNQEVQNDGDDEQLGSTVGSLAENRKNMKRMIIFTKINNLTGEE